MALLKKIGVWAGRFFLAAFALLAAVSAIAHINAMRETPPFDLVAVDGDRRLHALCEGPAKAPFVLYDAGAFGIYADGWWIKEALKDAFRVCLYDRAGLGWSDPAPDDEAPSSDWHVEDMRRLMDAFGGEAPYYVVGHSMAGLRLHAFANLYKDELAGLVFIDAGAPQQLDNDNGKRLISMFSSLMSAGVVGAETGLFRGVARFMPDQLKLPDQQRKDKERSFASPTHHKAARAEVDAVDTNAPYYKGEAVAGLPISVINASPGSGRNAAFAKRAHSAVGFGRVTTLPLENHVSLLNPKNAERVREDLLAMVAHRANPEGAESGVGE